MSNHAEQTDRSSRKRTWLITLIAVAVLAAIAIAVWVSTSGGDKDSGSSSANSSSPIAKAGLIAEFSGFKCGHKLNNLLLRALLEAPDSHAAVVFDEGEQRSPVSYQLAPSH